MCVYFTKKKRKLSMFSFHTPFLTVFTNAISRRTMF